MRADDSNKETRLTINQPLRIQNALLVPGQYVFKLAEPDTSRSVVGVYNADSNRLEGFIMGWAAYRTGAATNNFSRFLNPKGINQPNGKLGFAQVTTSVSRSP